MGSNSYFVYSVLISKKKSQKETTSTSPFVSCKPRSFSKTRNVFCIKLCMCCTWSTRGCWQDTSLIRHSSRIMKHRSLPLMSQGIFQIVFRAVGETAFLFVNPNRPWKRGNGEHYLMLWYCTNLLLDFLNPAGMIWVAAPLVSNVKVGKTEQSTFY